MRKMIFAAVSAIAATAAFAAPAQANEVRAEIHGGILWAEGEEEAVIGVAAGYDFDLGSAAFVGVEGSVDKILVDDTDLIGGLSARVGARVGEQGRLYAVGGYTFTEGEDLPHLGAGYQHKFGRNMYAKAEYRHYFGDFADGNTAVIGLGMTF